MQFIMNKDRRLLA